MKPSRRKLYRERAAAWVQKLAVTFLPGERGELIAARARREAFVRIMREQRWGEHVSGCGSTVSYTHATRRILEKVIRECDVTSLLDAGCGDFAWMPLMLGELPVNVGYVGVDIVPDLIERHRREYPQFEFRVTDLVVEELPRCDLIFCRDVVQHLPIDDAIRVLKNFSRSGARYLLTTTHLRRTGWRNARDKRVGTCHDRNLLLKPFQLADPVAIFSERDPGHKFLGLWGLPLRTLDGTELASPD